MGIFTIKMFNSSVPTQYFLFFGKEHSLTDHIHSENSLDVLIWYWVKTFYSVTKSGWFNTVTQMMYQVPREKYEH